MYYEKLYKEALERARICHKDMSNLDGVTANMAKDFFEEVFPELVKSEDEKTREELITHCRNTRCVTEEGAERIAKWIAWLEKQGEQPKKVSIWKHWKDGIAGNGEGTPVYLIKDGYTYSISSCLSFECDYIELSELDKLLSEKQGELTEINPSEFDSRLNKLLNQFESLPKEELITNLSYYLNVIQNDGTYKIEKQGKESIIDDEPEASYNNIMISDIKNNEKQGEQKSQRLISAEAKEEMYGKPIDKEESKFKVGDWVTCEELNTLKIVNIDSDRYEVEFIGGNKGLPHINYVDRLFHLWSIQDAKDGDVLYSPCLSLLWIFKSIDTVYCGCNLNYNDGAFCGEGYIERPTDAIPATKKQRDTLMKAIADAGYTFDFEKKELKLLITNGGDFFESENCEQNHDWSEEDENRINRLIAYFEDKESFTAEDDVIYANWLKSLKERIGG